MLVLWAIDAVREPGSLMERSADWLEQLASRTSIQVEPLFILGPSELDLGISTADHRAAAEKAIRSLVLQYAEQHPRLQQALLPPVVLVEPRPTLRALTRRLEDYAHTRRADAVALASHGRRGVWRLLLGSFAETLLLQAEAPTVCIGPGVEEVRPPGRILFATDFGPGSAELFRETVSLAKALQSSLLVFHSVPSLLEPILQSGAYLFSGSWIPARNYFAGAVQRRFRRGNAWARWASKQGVATQFLLDELGGNITERILDLIGPEKIDLLALASRSGSISGALLGSVTRQLVRTCPVPIWILENPAARYP